MLVAYYADGVRVTPGSAYLVHSLPMNAALPFVAALVLSLSASAQSVGCPTVAPDTSDWTEHDEGGFTVKLPPAFEREEAGGLDSQVGLWRSGESLVNYDSGYYSNKLVRDEYNPFPEMAVCQEGGPGSPRVIVYRTEGGRARLVAHWAGVDRDGFGEISLTLGGSDPSADHFAQYLGIVESVRFRSSPR